MIKVQSNIYEIRRSHKGGSWSEEFYFSKKKAEERAKELREKFCDNFKVITHACGDVLFWNE